MEGVSWGFEGPKWPMIGAEAKSGAMLPSAGDSGVDQRRRNAHLEAQPDPAAERKAPVRDQDELDSRPGNDAQPQADSAGARREHVDHNEHQVRGPV
jgi:hypothetical protein